MIKNTRLKRVIGCVLAFTLVLCSALPSLGAGALDLSFGTGEAVDNEGKYVYLSDQLGKQNVMITKNTQYGTVLADITPEQKPLTMRVEGQALSFKKGIWAHATSTLVFDISKIDNYEQYTRFSAFVGLNTTANSVSSVKFTISISPDNKQWTQKYEHAVIGTANGAQVIFDLDKGTKYLKLYADDMGGNGSDHSLYGDAMLITPEYTDPMKGPRLEAVDSYIRGMTDSNNTMTDELKLAILQRDFIASFGEYTLAKYVYEHPENRDFIENVILANKYGLLEEYVFGGTPNGTYSASMDVFKKLYDAYEEDLKDTKDGALYKRMMVTLALTHSQTVRSFIADVDKDLKALDQNDPKSPNVSDPVTRYKVFKELYNNGKLREMFSYLTVPFLRLVMSSRMGDDEYEWCNTYYTSRGSWYYASWINYSFDNSFVRDKYHDPKTAVAYQKTYGFSDKILNRTNLEKRYPAQWMVFADFGTCGIQAPLGVNLWNSIGIPAFEVSEPGHVALAVGPNWSSEKKQITSWIHQNSGTSWTRSSMGVYPPLGWGRGYYAYGSNLSYIWLSQYAVNDWENYKEAEYYIKLANCYGDDESGRQKRDELYKKALDKQSCNFDAYLKLFELYKSQDDIEKLFELGKRIIERYGWNGKDEKGDQEIFVLPMYDLLRQILPAIKTDLRKYIELSEYRLNAYNHIAEHDMVHGQIIKDLRGAGNSSDGIASFSFDGPNKKVLALGNMFDPADPPKWGYHFIDKNDKRYEGDAEKGAMSITLSDERFYDLYAAAASSDTNVGFNLYIDFKDDDGNISFSSILNIINSAESPYSATADDFSDRINGVTDETRWYWKDMENHPWKMYSASKENQAEYVQLRQAKTCAWRTTDGSPQPQSDGSNVEYRDTSTDKWKTFGEEAPPTEDEQEITLRRAATGMTVYSGTKVLNFTRDNSPNNNRCYSVEGITIVDYSSQVTGHPVTDAFNGDLSFWWTDNGTVQKSGADNHWTTDANDKERYVTVKFDAPIYLTGVQYTAATQDYGFECRAGYANGTLESGELYGSTDGLHWELLTEFGGFTYFDTSTVQNKRIDIPENKRKMLQYVKIHATKTYSRVSVLQRPKTLAVDGNGIFAARGFTFFQDATQNPTLTGVIRYSTEDPTNRNVTAQLVNLSTRDAVITGDASYTFTQNGSHTFHFTDPVTKKTGSATATVDWIDKEIPRAHVEYSTKEPTTGSVIAQLKIDEKDNEKDTLELNINGEWVPLNDIDADLELDATDKRRKYAVSPYEATMSENGIIDFELRDKAGNYATYPANVSWIYNEPPEAEVVYSTKNPTNGSVTATVRGVSTEIYPVEGESLTFTFDDNGDHVFRYTDAAGNEASTLAAVDWIDRTPPTAHVEYDITHSTKGAVTARLVIDSAEPVTVLGGGETYVFLKNGVHVFRFRDSADNTAEVTALVTWIAPGTGINDSGKKPAKPNKPSRTRNKE